MLGPMPTNFCWTRFGTEAGEGIFHILRRKERERTLSGGTFLWGIGNALGPSIRELLRVEREPEVLFSPIASAPKQVDVSPPAVVAWSAGRDLDGASWRLPAASLVTSRVSPGKAPRHYALVCFADKALRLDEEGPSFAVSAVENLLTSRPVGASQVTAVVRHAKKERGLGRTYRVAMRVRLIAPYFVELTGPNLVQGTACAGPYHPREASRQLELI